MRRFVLGEFEKPAACVEATRKLRESGVAGLDAYSPYPLHGGSEAVVTVTVHVGALMLAPDDRVVTARARAVVQVPAPS